MKKNLKLTVVALSVLLVMAIATTIASFSRADEPVDVTPLAAGEDDVTEYDRNTNIDYIILNAHKTPTAEELESAAGLNPTEYRIVEIGFGGKSDFGTMAENGDFADFVVTGNKSSVIEQDMDKTKVIYNYYDISAIGEEGEALTKIAQADFLYVSNKGGKASANNDFGPSLLDALNTYAIADYKPIIIDSPNASSSSGDGGGSGGGNGGSGAQTSATVNTVVKDYFVTQGSYNHTYQWDSAKDANTFLRGGIGNTLYIGVNSRTAQSKWLQLYETPGADILEPNDVSFLTRKGKVAKLLVVSADGSTGDLYNKLMSDASAVADSFSYHDGTETKPYVPTGELYTASETFNKIYSTRYSYRPDYVEVEKLSINDIATGNLDGYDLVVFENSCQNVVIGVAGYDRLVAAMRSKMYIVYDGALASSQQGTSSGGVPSGTGTGTGGEDKDKTNYQVFYEMIAGNDGTKGEANVMATNNSIVASMANSKSASICKPIADLINASAYRGIGGPKGSSTSFTVLEIQPAYPIDLDIAAAKNDYYTEGADMAPSGATKEQLPDGKEYYAWELSEAKIAEALRLEYDAVKVEHMSVEEFAASHTDLLGKYDMVYIGGNRSALKDLSFSYTEKGEPRDGNHKSFAFLGAGGEGYKDVGGNRNDYFFSLDNNNARDLSDYNEKQLNAFADAGMPIVLSKQLMQAYAVAGGVLSDKSKMRAFITRNKDKSNVLSDFDQAATVQDANGGLGDTLTGYVMVFDEATGNSLRTLYNKCTKRLLLAVTSRPAQYNLYDASTKLSSTKLNFKYDVNVDNYEAKLYIDHNNNGAFEEQSVASGKKGTLTYDLSEYKGGLIYWKLEVSSGKSSASSTGATYIKPNGEKQDIRVLQIVPDINPDKAQGYIRNYGPQGAVSLIFCTECQRALMPIKHNPIVTNAWGDDYKAKQALYMGQDNVSNFGNHGQFIRIEDNKAYTSGELGTIYLGRHEHKFGIVKYGGSTDYPEDYDDWDWNFADEIADKYNFHIDVMYTSEYDKKDAAIRNAYSKYITNGEASVETIASAKAETIQAKMNLDAYVAGTPVVADDYNLVTAEQNLRKELEYIRDNGITVYGNKQEYKKQLQRLLDEKCYYEFFSSFGSPQVAQSGMNANNGRLKNAYETWAKAHDRKIELTEAYMESLYKYNFLKSGGKDWLSQADGEDTVDPVPASYTSVVIGAAENFGNDDIGVSSSEALKSYCDNGGQVIMFHECMGRLQDYYIAANITKAVIGVAGVNAYADTQMQCEHYGGKTNKIYKYSSLVWNEVAKWNCNADYTQIEQKGTNRAVMNNRCAVNTFPFTLADKLKITGTHPVGFALDTDDMDVTPLYSLSTSTYDNDKQKIYPAAPADGSDNYFIYKSGNFYYCGAGHSKVTGYKSNNNDERRLYINIICSGVTNSSIMPDPPQIEVFDYGTNDETPEDKRNIVIKPIDNGYQYAVEEDVIYPNFTFKPTTGEGTSISSINVYYKLDPTFLSISDSDALKAALKFSDSTDKMIAPNVKGSSGDYIDIYRDAENNKGYPELILDANRFTPYGGNYTYIVIEVTDTKGNVTYQTIKIVRKSHLFDLT